jgi:hypothetical protein
MATDRANDLRAFRDFADLKLGLGEGDLTLDEALDLWESENQPPAERAATVQAVREAGLPHAAILEVDSSCVSSSGLRWSSCQKS